MTGTQLTFLSPDRSTPLPQPQDLVPAVERTARAGDRDQHEHDTTGRRGRSARSARHARQFGSVRNTTVFTYFDGNGATATTAANVDSVTVTVNVSTNTAKNRQFTYSTSIALRAGE